MKSQDLRELANGLDLIQDQQERERVLNPKRNINPFSPFSRRLNHWIENWYKQHIDTFVFIEVDDFDETDIHGTLVKHIRRYKETGKIHIWTGCSDNTIFGETETHDYYTINALFRAWHDYHHITKGYGYDFQGESIVSAIQVSELPKDWYFERDLINCEIVGQAQYFTLHGEFVKDQRQFTKDYFNNPLQAIENKQ